METVIAIGALAGFAVLGSIFVCGFISERRHNRWMAERGYRLNR